MKILSIDTTSMMGSVAITDDHRLLASEEQGVHRSHSEKLLVAIDHLLYIAGIEKKDIEAIAVATGPGSFTGLRIGLGVAKGMALALGVPIAGVSSLASLALNAAGFAGTTIPLIDARRGEIYAKIGTKEYVLPPEKLIARLKKIKDEMLLVGDGAIAFGEMIKKSVGKRVRIATGATLYPQAMNLAFLALPKLKKGKGDDISKLVPNYIRMSDAEIGFLGKGKK